MYLPRKVYEALLEEGRKNPMYFVERVTDINYYCSVTPSRDDAKRWAELLIKNGYRAVAIMYGPPDPYDERYPHESCADVTEKVLRG